MQIMNFVVLTYIFLYSKQKKINSNLTTALHMSAEDFAAVMHRKNELEEQLHSQEEQLTLFMEGACKCLLLDEHTDILGTNK